MRLVPTLLLFLAMIAQVVVGAAPPVAGPPFDGPAVNRHCGSDCTCGHACCRKAPSTPVPAPAEAPAPSLRNSAAADLLPPPSASLPPPPSPPASPAGCQPPATGDHYAARPPRFLEGCTLLI